MEKRKITIDYLPLPAQKKFHQSRAKYRLYSGAFRAGKTKAGCQEAIKLSLKYPGNRGLIGRKDYPDLRDTTQRTFFQELKLYEVAYGQPMGDARFGESEGILGFRKGENIFRFRLEFGAGEILFRQLKEPEDFKSLELGWFYLDEGTETTEAMFLMLASRLSLPHFPKLCGFITTNPDTPSHWIHKLFIESDNDEFEVVHTTSYDNPYLPAEYINSLAGIYDDDYAGRYLEGKWGMMSGIVYKEFSRDVHVIERFNIPNVWEKIRAIDFGYTNPFVCLWIAFDGDGRAYVYQEYYMPKRDIEHHAERIKELTNHDSITDTFGDPSAAQQRADLEKMGIPNQPADNIIKGKTDQDIAGIQAVQMRLKVQDDGKPRLFVFSECTNTIKEFELYKWTVSDGKVNEKELPLKLNDHAMDALRYAINAKDRGLEFVVDEVEF